MTKIISIIYSFYAIVKYNYVIEVNKNILSNSNRLCSVSSSDFPVIWYYNQSNDINNNN
jgi:hypothetical protein